MENVECEVNQGEKVWSGDLVEAEKRWLWPQMRRHHACCVEISIIYYIVFSEASAIYFYCCMSYFTL